MGLLTRRLDGFEYPKVDQVGIPDYSSGGRENWGLTTFREHTLVRGSRGDDPIRVALELLWKTVTDDLTELRGPGSTHRSGILGELAASIHHRRVRTARP
ncbi:MULTISPECIES: M1 family aminopeptidase [Nocardia]|uniref:M1 family aminopeptidase n=1 Tax=Nocardia TaxID=1817 RepID=UPI0035588F36